MDKKPAIYSPNDDTITMPDGQAVPIDEIFAEFPIVKKSMRAPFWCAQAGYCLFKGNIPGYEYAVNHPENPVRGTPVVLANKKTS